MVNAEAELSSVFGRPDEQGVFGGAASRERQARIKYWRKPDGWIERGPHVSTSPAKYQSFVEVKRWRELPDSFGREVMGAKGSRMFPPNGFPRGQEHHWLMPFFEAGGHTYVCKATDSFGTAGEPLMPMAQLVSLGLHRNEDMVKVRPDLATAVDVPCPYGCVNERTRRPRVFGGCTREEAEGSRDQHIVAVHKDAVASRAVGDTIANALANNAGQQINPELIASIVAAVAAAMRGPEAGAVAAVVTENKVIAEPEWVMPDQTGELPDEVAVEPTVWVMPDPTVELPTEVSVPFANTVSGQTTNTATNTMTTLPPLDDLLGPFSPDSLRQFVDSTNRAGLMAWASKRGIPRPTNAMKMTQQEWRDYIVKQFFPE